MNNFLQINIMTFFTSNWRFIFDLWSSSAGTMRNKKSSIIWRILKKYYIETDVHIYIKFWYKSSSFSEFLKNTLELSYSIYTNFNSFNFNEIFGNSGLYWWIPEGRNMSTIKDEEALYQNLKNIQWKFVCVCIIDTRQAGLYLYVYVS